jgi:thiamine kinase
LNSDPLPALKQHLVEMSLLPESAVWTPLEGGRSNSLWRVQGASGDIVVKLYAGGTATPLFANDAGAEAKVLEHLSHTGLAPRPIYHGNLSSCPVLIYTYQEGLNWRTEPELPAKVLKNLHQLSVPSGLRDLPLAPDGSRALLDQTLSILKMIPAHLAYDVQKLRPIGVVPPSGICQILHGDPVPDNFVCLPHDVRLAPVLIDWQCPALGDPILDLALFLSPAMQRVTRGAHLSEEERRRFLDAYNDPATEARLKALLPFFHWRMAAYCLWKITREKPDHAYAAALEAELAALKHVHA